MGTSYNPKIVTDGLVLNLDPANVKSYPAKEDPFVNNVSLMLDGESLTDKSQNNFTVTNSSVAVSSAQVKYGTSSLYFNGASYLSIPDSTAFGFGTGDFTIEFWLKLGAAITATSGDASFRSIVNKYSAGSNGTEDAFYVFLNNAAGTMQFNVGFVSNTTASNFAFNITGVDTSLNSVWNHVAVVRSSGSLKVYFNGTQIGTTQTYSSSINQGTLPLLVGARTYAPIDLYLNGYIDDLRITKAAIYTANFTPSTGPLSLPGRLTDLTKNKYLTTLTSGPTYSNNAINLSGTSQYLAVNGGMPSGTSTAFTFECWVRVTDLASYRAITRTAGGLDIGVVQTTGAVGCDQTAVATICATPSGAVVAGVWTHIAVTRTTGNLYTIYINGVSRASGTNAFTVTTATTIGFSAFSASHYFKGDMSIIKNYNRDLSANEILQNYNATKGRFGL